MKLHLRPARASDARLLWTWVNDPATRRNSFRTDRVPWDRHLAWFTGRLARAGTRLYIGLADGDVPVGQARFDRIRPGLAEISISVAPSHRGKGLGRRLVALASRRAGRDLGVRKIRAAIREENEASQAVFAAAGYRRLRRTRRRGCPSVLFGWEAGA